MKKIYKHHDSIELEPYIPNCYYSDTKYHVDDTEVLDPKAYFYFFEKNQLDFKKVRDAMKDYANINNGFSGLTTEYKLLSTEWFVCTPDEMIIFFQNELGLDLATSINLKIKNSIFFHKFSTEARYKRYGASFVFARNLISRENLENISLDLTQYNINLTELYLTLGREGSMQINYENKYDGIGLFDYIEGTTVWDDFLTSIGVTNKYNFEDRITEPLYGYTASDIKNKCIDILKYGNY